MKDINTKLESVYGRNAQIERLSVDCCDTNPVRFAQPFRRALPDATIVCQHKADNEFVRITFICRNIKSS